jgi:outer membrane protein assembly factor BamB
VLCGGLLHVLAAGGSRLEALAPESGRKQWSKDISAYGGRIHHAGAVVLLVSGDGTVHGLRGATGGESWRRSLAGHRRPVFSSYGDGRTAYAVSVAADGSSTLVTAVETATGEPRWERRLHGALSTVGTGSGGALLLVSRDSFQRVDAAVRYEPERRRELRVPLSSPMPSATAAVGGDTVYLLAYGGRLTAVDTRVPAGGVTGGGAEDEGGTVPQGAELWRMETSVSNASPLTVAGDRLYFIAADGRLLAVDSRRGALVGQTPARLVAGNRGYVAEMPAPVVVGGAVYAGAPDGTVFALRADAPSQW